MAQHLILGCVFCVCYFYQDASSFGAWGFKTKKHGSNPAQQQILLIYFKIRIQCTNKVTRTPFYSHPVHQQLNGHVVIDARWLICSGGADSTLLQISALSASLVVVPGAEGGTAGGGAAVVDVEAVAQRAQLVDVLASVLTSVTDITSDQASSNAYLLGGVFRRKEAVVS